MTLHSIVFALVSLAWSQTASAQQSASADGIEVYQQLRKFDLGGGSATVSSLVIQEDRAKLTFSSGTFYFETPIGGAVHGAVFIGKGQFQSEVPNSTFERQHVRRMLNAQVVESDFETAVLRFTDNTFEKIRARATLQAADAVEAQKLAAEFDRTLLLETGLNVSARMVISIFNHEVPGVFLAQFDKGRRGRFGFVFDPQGRIPSTTFDINGGEKGLIFANQGGGNDVWMAFYALGDYQQGTASYSDSFDLVEPLHYDMSIDVRNPAKSLRVETRLDLASRFDGVRAIPFRLNESLPQTDSLRLKRAMRVKSARFADGSPVEAIQEDWEGGLTVLLPAAKKAGERFSLVLETEGDFMLEHELLRGFYYPISTIEWAPRHGYLRRATFHLKFLHRKDHRIVSIGERTPERPVEGNPNEMITEWTMTVPVAFATFAVGNFQIHQDKAAGTQLPIEFYSLRDYPLKEDFVTAEMGNALNYFTTMFGAFPFKRLGGAFHPRAFGKGFPSLLMLPPADRATRRTFSFIAHETAHQWWGHVVSWRSYRDQWLSEGFAEYSGILYTRLRDGAKSQKELIDEARRSLTEPPVTQVGIGKGKLNDAGPIILGGRLESRETGGAYQTLIYNKGALILRMLHFLFTDTANGNGQAFFDMMKDFVDKHRGGAATTESFRDVASEHFARTPLAMKYQLKDLNWFFNEWVYQAVLPSYRLEYRLEDAGEGSFFLTYTLFQENAPQDWLMLLPLRFQFGKDKSSVTTVHALGPQTTGKIKLPAKPSSVELDPELWVLSERTSIREMK